MAKFNIGDRVTLALGVTAEAVHRAISGSVATWERVKQSGDTITGVDSCRHRVQLECGFWCSERFLVLISPSKKKKEEPSVWVKKWSTLMHT